MSAIVRGNRTGNKLSPATGVLIALGFVVVVFFLVTYGQQLLMEHSLKEKASAQRAANSALSDENSRLKSLLLYYQSDKYVEQRAREDLNLRRPEEEVIIPINVAPDAAAGRSTPVETPVPSQSGSAQPESDAPNWQRWFDLFKPQQ